jgi:hypothetical protein
VNGDDMNWQEQRIDELKRSIGAALQRRGELEGARVNPAGAAAVANEIRRLDSSIAEAAKSLADAERKLKDGR